MRLLYSLFAVLITAPSLFAQSYPSFFALSSNSPTCDGQNFKINVQYSVPPSGTSLSFRWSGPNSFTSNSYGTLQVPASAATAGVYSVTMVFAGTNTGTATASTTVALGTPKPDAYITYINQGSRVWSLTYQLCGPSSLSLVAYPDRTASTNSAAYQWTGPNGYSSNQQNPVVEQGAVGQYIVEATYPDGCGTGKDTVTVSSFNPIVYVNSYTVGPNPQFTTSFCPESAAELRAVLSIPDGTTATYQWSGPGGFTSTAQNVTLPNLTPAMAGAYRVTATVSGNCSGTTTASRTITIGAPSVFAFSSEAGSAGGSSFSTFCPGSSFRVAANPGGAVAYRWTGPNGFASTAQSTTLTNATAAMSGAYSVTVTAVGGCSGTATARVTIGTPAVQITSSSVEAASTVSSAFCTGSAFQMSASVPTGSSATYQWAGPNGFSSMAQSFTLTNATPTMAGAYSVTATFSGVCSGTATRSQTIEVGQPSIFGNSAHVCPGGQTQFSASIRINFTPFNAAATYRWSGPNGFSSTTQSVTLTNATPAMAGTYSVTAVLSGVCASTVSGSTLIRVTAPFLGVYSQATDLTASGSRFCPGTSVGMRSFFGRAGSDFPSARSTITYQWGGPNGFSSTDSQPTLPSTTAAASGLYSLTATITGECSGTYTDEEPVAFGPPTLSVTSYPIVGIASHQRVYCPGATVGIAINSSPSNASVTSYRWSGPTGFSSSAPSLTLTNLSTSTSGIYSVTATYGGQCAGQRVGIVNVQVGTPMVYTLLSRVDGSGSTGGFSICPGGTYKLSPAVDIVGVEASSVATYRWTLPNGSTTTDPVISIASAGPADAGRYYLQTTFQNGCAGVALDSIDIPFGPPIAQLRADRTFIPNGRPTTLFADNCLTAIWSNGQLGQSITVAPTQTTTYTVVCSYDGCTSSVPTPLTVRVSSQAAVVQRLHMQVSNRTPSLNQPIAVTLLVVNGSANAAGNVQVQCRLPNGLTLIDAGTMEANGSILTGLIPSVLGNGSASLTFQVAPTLPGVIRLSAQLTNADNPDTDSDYDSGTNDGQKDAAWADLRTQQPGTIIHESPEPNPARLPLPQSKFVSFPFGLVDLSLQMQTSTAVLALDDLTTITLRIDKVGDIDMLSPELTCQLPSGLTFVDGSGWTATGPNVVHSGGVYFPTWPQTVSFRVRATGSVNGPVKARISRSDWEDVDSDPANGFDTGEDDTAQLTLRAR